MMKGDVILMEGKIAFVEELGKIRCDQLELEEIILNLQNLLEKMSKRKDELCTLEIEINEEFDQGYPVAIRLDLRKV